MAREVIDAHWRDSARPARLFIVDYRAAFPLVVFIMHFAWWTFFTAIGAIIFFAMLERFGISVGVFLRWLRGALGGPRKMANPWWRG